MTMGIRILCQHGRIDILTVQRIDGIHKGNHTAARRRDRAHGIAVTVGISAPFGIILGKDRMLCLFFFYRRFGKDPVLCGTGTGIFPFPDPFSRNKSNALFALLFTESKITTVSGKDPECFFGNYGKLSILQSQVTIAAIGRDRIPVIVLMLQRLKLILFSGGLSEKGSFLFCICRQRKAVSLSGTDAVDTVCQQLLRGIHG